MATFEDRLSQLNPGAKISAAPSAPRRRRQVDLWPIVQPLLLILAFALGAASAQLGNVLQVVVFETRLFHMEDLPPRMGVSALGIAVGFALMSSLVAGRGYKGPMAVAAGFVAMLLVEPMLVQGYPDLWRTVYEGKYLQPVLDLFEYQSPEPGSQDGGTSLS